MSKEGSCLICILYYLLTIAPMLSRETLVEFLDICLSCVDAAAALAELDQ